MNHIIIHDNKKPVETISYKVLEQFLCRDVVKYKIGFMGLLNLSILFSVYYMYSVISDLLSDL
jgi:hypothetical protein